MAAVDGSVLEAVQRRVDEVGYSCRKGYKLFGRVRTPFRWGAGQGLMPTAVVIARALAVRMAIKLG